tara:strand:- start:41 stop:595 length:555 start_codon:yes stop_codon:yes gene_type:complete
MRLGARVRALRKERKWSLEELATRSGVALGTLSRVENDKGAGNIRTHQRISEALQIPISELYLGLEEPEDEATLVQPDTEEAESFKYDEKASAVLLAKQVSSKKMLPQLLSVAPHGKSSVEQCPRGTERWVFGLAGALTIQMGEKSYSVEKGGALYFKASMGHQFINSGESPAKCIVVTSPVVL